MQPDAEPNPVATLQTAYERTLEATKLHNWQGTTTVCGAQLHYTVRDTASRHRETIPLLYVTNLGDCQVMVLRPREQEILYKTKEQWHWFDCPRQLGTNSPDTPETNAVVDTVDIEVGDVVLAMTDGVIDNLWEHEIVDIIFSSIRQLGPENSESAPETQPGEDARDIMKTAAQNLVAAAKRVAMDPYAESPFMEHAIEEGLASVGGRLSPSLP
jgi:serine/threonine protein phosphatase PrpC